MDRFDGKKVIECQVSDGISKADALIERAINGDAPVFHAAEGSQKTSSGAKSGGGAGHKIYPLAGILIMGLLMTFIVEPIMGGLNTGLNNALTGMGSRRCDVHGI